MRIIIQNNRRMSTPDRILRHMAKDKPDYISFIVDRDDLLRANEFPNDMVRRMEMWKRWMVRKHGPHVKIHTFEEFDFDTNKSRFIAKVKA